MRPSNIQPPRLPSSLLASLTLLVLCPAWSHAGPPFPEFIDPNPNPGNHFGATVVALSTGNVVITSPSDDAGGSSAGAVYLFNGATGALISTLKGSHAGDNVGNGGVTALSNGNFVVTSVGWANYAGAVTWGSGTSGVSGIVSSSNSLVGTQINDKVGNGGVTELSNGNYVVISYYWANAAVDNAGAVTLGSGSIGVSGAVTISNSLVGTQTDDIVGGGGVTALSNGSYVVISSNWDNASMADAGAVTWGSATSGVNGAVSVSNSLVGTSTSDWVGISGVEALTNGNYVVRSSRWKNATASDAGAVTWGSGTNGVRGALTSSNSLVGTTAGDQVGYFEVTALSNGNYVVCNPRWDNNGVLNAGAVTWGSGSSGVSGALTSSNSLVGTTATDGLGNGGVTALSNGNYVVASPDWINSVAHRVGAVTWGSGISGINGLVGGSNSLVGTTAGDAVGNGGVTALSNGNYVVISYYWTNTGVARVGAVTWGSGNSGVSGAVSADNSLVGTTANDHVGYTGFNGLIGFTGYTGVTALSNGNYVVASPDWHNGGLRDAGAVTWGNGTSGVSGAVTISNSLVGTMADNSIGYNGVTALSNGNYVVRSVSWQNTGMPNAGAVTWGSGTSGVSGAVSSSNSLVGSTSSGSVGNGEVTALSNGNYVVTSPYWRNDGLLNAGAVTWCSGTSGMSGTVSKSNSLVGSQTNDNVGNGGVTALSNGCYVVRSYYWDNTSLNFAGAVTWGNGTSGVSGEVSSSNSLVGLTSDTNLIAVVADDVNGTYYGRFLNEDSGKVRLGSQWSGLAPNVSDIAVAQANPLTDGLGSVPFGNVQVGSSAPLTFSITNSGSANLKNLVVTKNGTNATDFTVSALSGTSIPVGTGAVTFTVTFAPSSGGAKTAALHIASNVSGAKNPFDINLTGTGQLSSNANLSSLSLSSVTLTPAFATDIISYTAEVPNAITTLTVAAVKAEPLASVQVRVNGGNYVIPSSPLALIVGTNTVEVLVTAQNGTTTKTYTVTVTRAEGPEIAISGNSVGISDADSTPSELDHTHFGSLAVTSGMITRTFSISNTGALALNLAGTPAVQLSGGHAADFQVTLMPGTPVAASSNTTFQIAFDPSVSGLRTAVVSIDSDDADENPYTFAISGTGRVDSQAAQTIAFTPPAKLHLAESPLTLIASSSSGLPVSYALVSGPATLSGDVLTFTGTGAVKVRASQSGNADFLAAVPVERTITVAANPTTLTLANLSQTYTGTPRPITVLGATGVLEPTSVDVTYKREVGYVSDAPTNAGSYPVKAAVAGGATKTGTLVITKAPLFVTPDDQRKFAGQVNPALGFSYSGFLGGDNAANSVSKAPVIATTASATSAGGLYPITASGGTSANYLFVCQKGTMKVETFAAAYEVLLVDEGTLRISAKLELTVAASSKTFTGKLTTPTETAALSLKGTLTTDSVDETATGTATVKKGENTYLVEFTLPLTGDFTATAKRNGAALGGPTNGSRLLTLAKGQTLSYIGTHSALLAPATGVGAPAGAGWAVATIDAKGLLKLTGKLADGTGLTASLAADVSSDPGYRLFIQPYTPARTGAFVAGAFTLKPQTDEGLIGRRYVAFEDAADLTWVKAERQQDSSYRDGFGPVDTRFTLDPWLPPVPAKGLVPAITLAQRLGLSGPANEFTAQHSTISSPSFGDLPTTLTLNGVNVVAPAKSTKWKVTIAPATGAFVGSFELNDDGKKRLVPFAGMMRQPPSTDTSGLIGDGNFQLPSLTPAPNNEVLSGEVGFER